jgi:hypothetical protein
MMAQPAGAVPSALMPMLCEKALMLIATAKKTKAKIFLVSMILCLILLLKLICSDFYSLI